MRMPLKAGFIGLGEMGKRMALNVLKAGFPLTVYDIQPDRVRFLVAQGASGAESPSQVAMNSDCILMSLPDTRIVEEVVFGERGLAEGASAGSFIVDLSTIDYSAAVRLEKKLRENGVFFIDSPVSGMEARAKEGTLTVMVGGDPAAFGKIRPVLEAIGKKIVYMGKSGNGQLAKLVNQLLFNISAAAMAEILPMAVKLGLDPEAICSIVTTGTGRTFALEFFTPHILQDDFKTGYPLAKAYKDMKGAVEISSREGIHLPVFSAAMQTYQLALAQGLGDEDKGAMIKVWEKILGVEVRRKSS